MRINKYHTLCFRLFVFLCLCTMATGCVERKIRIESEPSVVNIFMDGQYLGTTPKEIPFTFYGTREIRLEKEGYHTVVLLHKLNVPVYQWFPLDFVSENIIPFTFRDTHILQVELTKRDSLSSEQKDKIIDELEASAQNLRKQIQEN